MIPPMRTIPLLLPLLLLGTSLHAQTPPAWRDSLDAYWARMDAEFADSATSPLDAADRGRFKHLERFPVDERYRVHARFEPAPPGTKEVTMRTSTQRTPVYRIYGTLHFTLNGVDRTLQVYENAKPDPRFPGYLFLPFTDLTNGDATHGSGRYLDLQAPLGPEVIIDFNEAYNPYCAYSDRFSCPVPPAANHLATRVEAGVLEFRR